MRFVRSWVGGFLFLLGCGMPFLAQSTATALESATVTLTMASVSTTTSVELPYGWDYHHRGQSGVGQFQLHFEGPQGNSDPWALYFYRLGNAYQVRLNGNLLEQNGSIPDPGDATQSGAHFDAIQEDYAKVPRFMHIPANVLKEHNLLEVTIRSDSGRRSGMPVVWVGPQIDVEPLYRKEFLLRVGSSAVVTVFSLIVGLFAAVLWISQTDPRPEHRGKRDNLYLYAAIAEFSWALFIGDSLIERPPLAWAYWSIAVNMVLGVWLSALLLFCHCIAGWEHYRFSRWTKAILASLIVVGPGVAYYTVAAPAPLLLTLWQTTFALVFVPSTLLFVLRALRPPTSSHQPTTMHRLVALAFLVNVPIGVHDFYMVRMGDSFAGRPLLRYSAVLFGLSLAMIAVNRFRNANLQVRDMLDTLAVRVEDKEQELLQSYQRMEHIAREQERTQERSRILRDMHDGVGSHISSAIRQLRSGHSNPDEVLLTLQDSLDQLKLSIDALNLPPGDITALLANLRYRLEPRFKAMGMMLEWAVVPVADLPHLDASAMRQLQYIFFEAFSNVMQHAHASVLRIEATPTLAPLDSGQPLVRIRVCDNGCGFDTTATPRKGLGSMQERAAAVGAQLHISSQPGETVVEILLA